MKSIPQKNCTTHPYGSAVRVLAVPDCNRQYLCLETMGIP